jgi:hypothetical protein
VGGLFLLLLLFGFCAVWIAAGWKRNVKVLSVLFGLTAAYWVYISLTVTTENCKGGCDGMTVALLFAATGVPMLMGAVALAASWIVEQA